MTSRRNRRQPFSLLAACALVAATLGSGSAKAAVLVEVDEYGNGVGTIGRGVVSPDPGPGGQPSTLTYRLPFAGTQGDVGLVYFGVPLPVLQFGGGTILDVLRFNGNGTVVFYSDDLNGLVSLADNLSPPGSVENPTFHTNFIGLPQTGGSDIAGAFYTPSPGQPGYDATFQPTYRFISDRVPITVPEPASVALLAPGGLGIAVSLQRRRAPTSQNVPTGQLA